mmetsp:Transcript_47286/g.64110  ORF Transcript_47286/g.64110 Transcript_47286/m.64110 type:complete len:246 (+) Transcript_47286:63-800(+)
MSMCVSLAKMRGGSQVHGGPPALTHEPRARAYAPLVAAAFRVSPWSLSVTTYGSRGNFVGRLHAYTSEPARSLALAQLGVHLRPDLLDGAAAVDFLHDALRAVVGQDGDRLVVVGAEALLQRIGGVVGALEERRAALVILHRLLHRLAVRAELHGLRRAELHVVRPSAGLVHPAAADALLEHGGVDVEGHHERHGLAIARQHLVERVRLGLRAREAVEDEAAGAVGRLDAVCDDADDDRVIDEAA